MECPACLGLFNIQSRSAIKLSCLHLLCKACVNDRLKVSIHVECPLCLRYTHMSVCNEESQAMKQLVLINEGGPAVLNLDQYNIQVIIHCKGHRFFDVNVQQNSTIRMLKELISTIENIPVKNQILIVKGVSLDDNCFVRDYQIKNADLIQLAKLG